MTVLQQPPTMDPRTGDVTIHGRSGAFWRIDFRNPDGTARDVSASALFFEIDGVLRAALGAGAASNQRTVTVTRAEIEAIAALPGGKSKFALIDETGAVPEVLIAADIRVNGYTGAPV